jgi:hypothetical protein
MRTGSKKAQNPRPSLLDRIEICLSVSRVVDGLWLGTININDELILRRLEEALGLIKAYDKRRYNRLLNDLERVWVRLLPGELGHFSVALRSCVLDTRFVLDETTSPEMLATVIVHEATHARLRRCGIGYDEDVRHQVEAICHRRELAFVCKLPNGQSVREWVERAMEVMQHPSTEYTDAAFAKRQLEGNIENLRHLGAPKWLVRLAEVIQEWRTRGRQRRRSL